MLINIILLSGINTKPDYNVIWGTELYDHSSLDDFYDENSNVADEEPQMKQVVKELCRMLQAIWRAVMTP